jgi:hypothetical protein
MIQRTSSGQHSRANSLSRPSSPFSVTQPFSVPAQLKAVCSCSCDSFDSAAVAVEPTADCDAALGLQILAAHYTQNVGVPAGHWVVAADGQRRQTRDSQADRQLAQWKAVKGVLGQNFGQNVGRPSCPVQHQHHWTRMKK